MTAVVPLFFDDRLVRVDRLLEEHYGEPERRVPWDPLKQFIYSLISPRTKTEVTYEVVRGLEERFGCWEALRDAPLAEIEDALRLITFPEQKAVHLKRALQQITEKTGGLSLDFLARYRTEKIRAWLEQFEGVGVKTSGAVVNFSKLRRRALCVDSHHLRVCSRLGLITSSNDAREAERRLFEMVPAEWDAEKLDAHHQLIKVHGQKVCVVREPRCGVCPVRKMCATGAKAV